MADVAVETHDPDYQSAVRSLWDNMVNKKYYLTGGVGSGETSEGFGPDYSLGNDSYCEACSTCGAIFFHWKMNLMNHDARYADQYELSMYNALLGSLDLEGKNYYYDNPLTSRVPRYPWHACPCCVGNIPRTLLMMPTWMYAKDADRIEADRGKVALRYGPLVYNIEQVDQDITKALGPTALLTTEWKPDLLGGVVVIRGQFTAGSPMIAVPNFARTNRDPALPEGQRASRRPPTSIVWIAEG